MPYLTREQDDKYADEISALRRNAEEQSRDITGSFHNRVLEQANALSDHLEIYRTHAKAVDASTTVADESWSQLESRIKVVEKLLQ